MTVQADKQVFVQQVMDMFESPTYRNNDAVSTFLFKLVDYLGLGELIDTRDSQQLQAVASRVFNQYETACKSYYAFFDNVFMAEMVGMTYNKETLDDDLFKAALQQKKKPKEDSTDDWSILTAPILLSDHSYLFTGVKLIKRDFTVLLGSVQKFYKAQKIVVSEEFAAAITEKLMTTYTEKLVTLKRAAVADQQQTYDNFTQVFLADVLIKNAPTSIQQKVSAKADMRIADLRRMKRFIYLLSENSAALNISYATKALNGVPFIVLPHPKERDRKLFMNVFTTVDVRGTEQHVLILRKDYEAYGVFNELDAHLQGFYGKGGEKSAKSVAELFRKAIDLRLTVTAKGHKI